VTADGLPRAGQWFVMVVRPADWYAGKIGDRAVVEDASPGGIYVLFDSGLRESYPPAKFVAYFKPAAFEARRAVEAPKIETGPWLERTPSGRILLHRGNDLKRA
jgi:hypothetical protein